MIESVMRTSCEVIEYGWSKDRAPVDTFIMGLAASIRERNDYDEQVRRRSCLLKKFILVCSQSRDSFFFFPLPSFRSL